jgi:two-component system response regulator FlrC
MLAQGLELVGTHPKFRKAVEFAKNVSVTKSPVLLVGETGTGKKAFCQMIHSESSRTNGPFFVVDCSQEEKKVEDQLLGFRDEATGSFTKGVLEQASNGTVVFANIDGLAEAFQKRIYQIIQELPDYDLDVRILATTTKNLSKYVGAGRFYRALFTYFTGTQITLSPLRERPEDIEAITKHYISKFIAENNTEVVITQEALDKVNNFYWTHNVAELKSVIEAAAANCNGSLDINAIELGEKKSESMIADSDDGGIKLMSLKDAERLLIKKALIHTSENRTQAAKILGVSIRTLRNKINEYRGEGSSYFVNLR